MAGYDTLIKLTSHFWSRDILSIRDCFMEPFLNLPSNLLLVEIEISRTSHSAFHQWDKWTLTQPIHLKSTRSRRLCEVFYLTLSAKTCSKDYLPLQYWIYFPLSTNNSLILNSACCSFGGGGPGYISGSGNPSCYILTAHWRRRPQSQCGEVYSVLFILTSKSHQRGDPKSFLLWKNQYVIALGGWVFSSC